MSNKRIKGFTLIETIIYMGLFGMLIGGGVVAAYNIFEGTGRAQSRAMLQEEGGFIAGKIAWTLSGISAATLPAAGVTGSSLTVTKWDTSIGNPITISLAGTDLTFATSSNAGQILNNSNTRVSNLLFLHTLSSGNGADPETIQFSFTLSTYTPTGRILSQNFATTTVSLRR